MTVEGKITSLVERAARKLNPPAFEEDEHGAYTAPTAARREARDEAKLVLQEALDEIERLTEALEFYANPIRYHGPNQRNDGSDPASGDDPYIKDVMRDLGGTAQRALKIHQEKSE